MDLINLFKVESDIYDEKCKYCDDIMNVCNHPLNPDMYAKCRETTCPIKHPDICLT